MGCIGYESYYFSGKEWNLLLAGIGVQEWYGLDSGERDGVLSREEGNRALVGLYQKEVICWESEGIAILQPFADMFAALQGSRYCIAIQGNREARPIRCCYIGPDHVVLTERSQREENALCVSCLPKGDFLSFLMEIFSEYTPGVQEGIGDGKALPESFLQAIPGEGMPLLELKLRDSRNGRLESQWILREHGLQTYMVLEEEGRTVRFPYQPGQLLHYMGEWLERDKAEPPFMPERRET